MPTSALPNRPAPTPGSTPGPVPEHAGPLPVATLAMTAPGEWDVGGAWTVDGLGPLAEMGRGAGTLADGQTPEVLDGSRLQALDSAGAWVLHRWLRGREAAVAVAAGPDAGVANGGTSASPVLRAWPARAEGLMREVAGDTGGPLPRAARPGVLVRIGHQARDGVGQARDFVAFVGEVAVAAAGVLRHPNRLRVRSLLSEIQAGGFDALPIVGLTSFLLGIVIAYQGADQLKNYGANIFVVELVGYAMLREFAPLMSAIIVAGRSGSAYAAQIGTMVVTEEIDAMRTLGIDPQQRLVLPKVLALAVALPLLTVFADVAGVLGGMVMARSQLGIGFGEFIDRFGRVMQGATFLIGIGKSLVFALIIVLVGCFQGFRTQGSADSVGRQTTQSVVQAIFLVIVADALFSIAFNLLGL